MGFVIEFYEEVLNGKVLFVGEVVGLFILSCEKVYYVYGVYGNIWFELNFQMMVNEVVILVIGVIYFNKYDND